MNKNIVIFGGGTGSNVLLSGLKYFPVSITAVVCVSDNGRSTGKLREEFNMPAIGDIRNVITSLADTDDKIKELLSYRFNTSSDLNGHPIGNLIMVGMYNLTGSLTESIKVLSKFLNVKANVLPISEDNLTLIGKTSDGMEVVGEENITLSHQKYEKFYYKEEPHVLEEVKEKVRNADLIIFSMGSLITSILPHILCKELISEIDKSKAKIMYTCNAVSQTGETDNFTVSDHVKLLNSYLGKRKIEVVVAANTKIKEDVLNKYLNDEQKSLVRIDYQVLKKINCKLIKEDILVINNGLIRHDSIRLANIIFNYLLR